MRRPLAGLALALTAAVATPALAAPPEDEVVSARLSYLEGALLREQEPTRVWRDGWLGAFAGLSLLQVAVGASTTDRAVRGTAVVGGVKSVLAAASILIVPSTAVSDSTTLRAIVARTPAERRARLAVAEGLLQRVAAQERFRRSWIPLVAGTFLNLGGATILWAGYHRPGAGWFGLGSGLVVGQFYYQSQPTGALASWAAYTHARDQGIASPILAALKAPSIRWSLAPSVGGLAVRGTF